MRKMKLILVSLLSCIALTMQAERLFINDFTISPGETKTMSVELENEIAYKAFQLNMTLPEGLSFANTKVTLTDRCVDFTSWPITEQPNGDYTLMAANINTLEGVIVGNNGAIFSVDIVASEDMEVGSTPVIKFSSVLFEDENPEADDDVKWEPAPFEQAITIVAATEPEPDPEVNKLYIEDFAIDANVSYENSQAIAVKFNSEYQIKGISGELELVDGLMVDEWIDVAVSMRQPQTSITVDGNVATFSISTSRAITVYEGDLFILYFYTAEDFAGTHTAELRNVTFTDSSGEVHALSNSTFTVTGPAVEDNEVELSVQSSYYNNVVFYLAKGTEQKIRIETTNPAYKLNTVVLDGEDVTSQVVDGVFTTPALENDAIINISYIIPTSQDAMQAGRIKAYGYNGDVVVAGCERGESIAIYDIDGVLLRTIYATGDMMRIAMPADAVYVVNVSDMAIKVTL